MYDEIQASGNVQATILPLALEKASDRDFENTLAQAIQAQLKRLDGILHNASHFTHLGPLEHEHLEDWSQMLRVNLIAALRIDARMYAPAERRAGCIRGPYGRDTRVRTSGVLGRILGIQERIARAECNSGTGVGGQSESAYQRAGPWQSTLPCERKRIRVRRMPLALHPSSDAALSVSTRS